MIVCFCLTLGGLSIAMLELQVTRLDILLWFISALIASVAVCGFFYAGLFIAGTASFIGISAGIIYMGYIFLQPIEWRGIVGYMSGAQLAFLIFLAGVNAQMIRHVWNKRKAQRAKS